MSTTYDAADIQVLEGLEAVRRRPGMYIGSTGEKGLHHLVYEVVDNSVDEAMAGHAEQIVVTLLADGGVRVSDDGRGIPVDEHPIEKRSALEVVLTTLHAGGKFGGQGYSVSGGLHGVGISVVNALSSKLEVCVKRDGFEWNQTYKNGEPTTPLKKGSKTSETGTTVTFWPNSEIFETSEFSFSDLAARFREMAFLNAGLSITIIDERPVEPTDEDKLVLCYPGGIVDFVSYLNGLKGETLVNPTVVKLSAESERRGMSLDLALQWNQGYNEAIFTFANTINTQEGGTHEEGLRTSLTSLLNKYARTWGVLKEKDQNLLGEDVREGLTAIVSLKLREPQFEGQTKTKLGNTSAKTFVQSAVNEQMGAWLEANPNEGREIARKAVAAATARIAARKARDLARNRKGLLGSSSLPGKLSDCQSTEPEECELFIVEGDSAGGSAKNGRDSRIQAILPIRTLLLTLLFRYMRQLVIDGRIYLAQPPLYKIKWIRDTADYAYSDQEKDGLIEAGLAAGKRLPKGEGIQRYKGLGEMNSDELWETTMNPESRVLLQVKLEDAMAADEMFSVLMGEDVESRRKFIQKNAHDVRFLDI
jgi:DNA gyrase subunit B